MKRCLFSFKSLFLSLTLLFIFSSFARAETYRVSVYAEVPYADFVGSGDLPPLTFKPIDSSLPYKVYINADVFRRGGYFGILPLPGDWSTLGTITGCASNVWTGLSGSSIAGGSPSRDSDIAGLNYLGTVKFTRVSVNSLTLVPLTIGIYAEVDLSYQITVPGVMVYYHIELAPTDFHACISPSGGYEAPVPYFPPACPEGVCDGHDGPDVGRGDTVTAPPTTGTTGPGITDTGNDSFGPPASVPTSPVGGGRSFFQGGGCSLGAGLPNSASSLAWVLFGLFGGMGLFRIRQSKKN